MRANFLSKILLFAVILLLTTCVSAATMKSDDGGFKVTYPDSVNVFEPIILHFEVSDKELIEKTDFLFGEFAVPLSEGEGFKHLSDLPVVDINHYDYNGEKSFDIVISLYVNGALDLNNKDDFVEKKDDLETLREIVFHSDNDGVLDLIKIPIKVNPYNFDIENVPEGFLKDVKDLNTLSVGYSKADSGMSNHVNIGVLPTWSDFVSNERELLSFDDLKKPLTQPWTKNGDVSIPEGYTQETFAINDYPALLFTNCEVAGWEEEDEYRSSCNFNGQVVSEIGIIKFDIRMSTGSNKEPKISAEARVEKWKGNARDMLKNVIIDGGKKGPEREKLEEIELECTEDSQCDAGSRCTACGECYEDAIDPSEVELEIELSNKLSSKSIYNSIREKAAIRTTIKPTFTHGGKKIDYCDIATPGIEKELVAEMKNDDFYAGFVMLSDVVNEERTKTEKTIIDFNQKTIEHTFVIRPINRKKMIGQLGEVTENIEIKVEDLAVTNEKIILKPVDLSMDIKSAGEQVHQDSNKLIKITAKDNFAKNIFFKASLIGPGEIELGESSRKVVYANTKPNELIKLMYYAPELGNFDIGNELASLSMVDLQVAAAKQIAEDTALAYAGDYFQGLEKLNSAGKAVGANKAGMKAISGYFARNPGKYNPATAFQYVNQFNSALGNSKKLDLMAKSYKLYAGTYGLTQIPKGVVDMRDDMKDMASTEYVSNKKTWTETIAETAVVGIDVAQTGLSILTFVPSKIPLIKDILAPGKSAFSAMTNIWKGNFKYIATDEKIARADEKFYPVMVLMTAEDESGWRLTQGYVIQVAYHEI